MNKPIIILVAPQMGENIGACARAIKNFGLNELRIVKPRDGWPNIKAEKMAVGAVDIIKKARIFDELKDAVADLEYLYATTAVRRDIKKEFILAQDLRNYYLSDLKIGIMFGRENSGLNNEEIGLANKIITINSSSFSSLNIAQAVIIICYEIFNINTQNMQILSDNILNKNAKKKKINNLRAIATKAELEFFFEHLIKELDIKNFFNIPQKKPKMVKNIRNIFARIDKLSRSEVQTLRGIVKFLASNDRK